MKKRTFFMAVLTMASAVLLLAGCSSGESSKTITIDLADYVTLTSSGYDGNGTADFAFKKGQLINDYKTEIDYSSSLKSEAKKKTNEERADFILYDDTLTLENLPIIVSLENADAAKVAKASDDPDAKELEGFIAADIDMYNEYTAADMFNKFLSVSLLNKTQGLSNGDVITVSFDSADQLEEYFNVEFENATIEYIVSDLTEAEEIDPFEDIEIIYSGTTPNGQAEIENNSTNEAIKKLKFSLSETKGLSNGDTIVVSISGDTSNLPTEYGIILSSTEKEYTVEGLGYYVTELSQIPDNVMRDMQETATNIAIDVCADPGEIETVTGMDFIGNFLLVAKGTPSSNNSYNTCYFVYEGKVDVSTENSSNTFYTCVGFNDLILFPNGTCSVNTDKYTKPSDKVYSEGGSAHWYGYSALNSLFNTTVVTNIDKYTYESTVPGYEK